MHHRSLCTLTLAVSFLTWSDAARSQPPPPAPAAPEPDVQAKKDEARQHFERGLVFFDEEAWDSALAEFLRSRDIFASRAATKNAATCLRRLKRYDESIDLFENLLASPGISPEDKALAEREIATLRGLLGTLDIKGAEAGATIVVDGRDRGITPARGPLRVSVGTHVVHVYKDGFQAFEARVDVAGGESKPIAVNLARLAQAGRLKVVEDGGRSLEVVVDNVVVGKTPWEGSMAIGDHTVFLRGDELGTQPASAPVRVNQVTPLTLAAERLAASLRVQPTPAGATIALDGVSLGRGLWEGKLRVGGHRIEIAAEGFVPQVHDVAIGDGKREILSVTLERDPTSSMWRDSRGHFFIEVDSAFGLAPTLGSDLAAGCTAGCSSSLGLGFLALGRGGYRFASGFMVGIDAGYLLIGQKVTGRATTVTPQGLAPNPGKADDALTLRAGVVGASAGIRLGSRFPVTLRLGTGVVLGSLGDHRTGSFHTVARAGKPEAAYTADVSEAPSLTALYLAPEARFGVRLGERFELSVGAAALVLLVFLPPRWAPKDKPVLAATDGQGTFPADALTSKAMVVVVPGLGARYEF